MARGGRRPGAGRKPGKKAPKPSPAKIRPTAASAASTAPAPFAVVEGGGGGGFPEPDWSIIFADELDISIARHQWGAVIRELRDTEKLAFANGHQIKRLVISYVIYEAAIRNVAENGAVYPRKGRKQPAHNPWFSVLKDANAMAATAEAELTITPRRRNNGGKVKTTQKASRPSDAYLRPVAK